MIRVGIIGFAHGHVFSFGGEWKAHPEYGVEIAGGWEVQSDVIITRPEPLIRQALLGKDYFLIPTLVSCLIALLILRKPIEKKEGMADE